MTSPKDLLKDCAINDSDDEDASQGVQRRSTVPQRPDATPRSSLLAYARTPDTPDTAVLMRRDRASATASESSKSASEQRSTHLPSAPAVRELSSASVAAAVPSPSVSQPSSKAPASYQRAAPLTPLEQVMFVLFVALGIYLLFAWVSWSFAVATGSDTGHPFGGTRFIVRANDAWPAPIAAVLRFVTGTAPVDDSIILA
jgi:hypothetical protein